ncbi:MAG: OadG family protein [Halanaerobium sp.]|nr:OadG family protein [Halanaerobium sp.]
MTPLEMLKHPELIGSMSLGDKLTAGLQVTILGMVIVFVILMLLQVVVAVMERMTREQRRTRSGSLETTGRVAQRKPEPVQEDLAADSKLIAAITAALTAGYLQESPSQFRVKRISRIVDDVPVWGKVARGGGNKAVYFQTNKEG